LRRELREELGLREFALGPLLWTRTHRFADMARWGGQTERHYLVRVAHFEPAPEIDLAAEKVAEVRWFEPDQLDRLPTAPRRLGEYVRDLIACGPREPFDAGV
jgi:8-oxo-dGTP pyrophosphatase MutT (NUDIX family)